MNPGSSEQAVAPGRESETAPDRGVHRVTLAGLGLGFDVPAGERIHTAARRAGIWLPFACGWGGCGTCKATVVEGRTELMFAQAPAVDPRDERRRRILLCQSTPVTDLVIKAQRADGSPPDERPTTDLRGHLVAVEPLGPQLARFRFTLVDLDGEPAVARYRPGQYAVLELAPGLRRCYSMAGLPGTREVEFIAKHYPGRPGSSQLFALEPGAVLPLELPYGDVWLRDDTDPVLLIAGGTGVSFVLALLRSLAAQPISATGKRPVQVFYGATNRADLVCWDELTDLVARLPDGQLHGALLDPDETWTGTRGWVTDALRPQLPAAVGSAAYLAGPPPMAQAVHALLSEHGWSADRIHKDSFG